MDEHAAKKLLILLWCAGYERKFDETQDEELAAASAKIGYPVALKACHWEIMHKSGKGLIALNVENANQLKKEFKGIQPNCGKSSAGTGAGNARRKSGISGRHDALCRIRRVCVFGLGGVFTEIYNDTTFALHRLPLPTRRRCLPISAPVNLLDEFRGMPKVKTDKLSQIIQAVGNISLLHPEIAEIDLNPIIINEDEPVVADALIVLTGKL